MDNLLLYERDSDFIEDNGYFSNYFFDETQIELPYEYDNKDYTFMVTGAGIFVEYIETPEGSVNSVCGFTLGDILDISDNYFTWNMWDDDPNEMVQKIRIHKINGRNEIFCHLVTSYYYDGDWDDNDYGEVGGIPIEYQTNLTMSLDEFDEIVDEITSQYPFFMATCEIMEDKLRSKKLGEGVTVSFYDQEYSQNKHLNLVRSGNTNVFYTWGRPLFPYGQGSESYDEQDYNAVLDTYGLVKIVSGVSGFAPFTNASRNCPGVAGEVWVTSGETRTVNLKYNSASSIYSSVTLTIFKNLDGTKELYASGYTSGDTCVYVLGGDPVNGVYLDTRSDVGAKNTNRWTYIYYYDNSSLSFGEIVEIETLPVNSLPAVANVYPGVAYTEDERKVYYNDKNIVVEREEVVEWRIPVFLPGGVGKSPVEYSIDEYPDWFPMAEEFFNGSQKIRVKAFYSFQPGYLWWDEGATYPDPAATNTLLLFNISNTSGQEKNLYEIDGGCENLFINYDPQTRKIYVSWDEICS